MKKTIPLFFVSIILFACPPLPHQTAYRSIEYKAYGRGGSEYIGLDITQLKYISNDQDTITQALSRGQLKKLYAHLQTIDLESMNTFKVPSTKHQFDGAFAATLSITDTKGQKFSSPTFDDDNPPKEIKGIIEYIKSISKK